MLFSRKFCSAYLDISVWCTYKPLLTSHGYVCSFYGPSLLNSLAFVWSVVYELFRWNRCHMEALMFYVISHTHSCYKHFTGALSHEWFISSALWWPVERAGLAGCPCRHPFPPRPLSQHHCSPPPSRHSVGNRMTVWSSDLLLTEGRAGAFLFVVGRKEEWWQWPY